MKRRTISKRVSKNKRSLHKRPLKRTNKKSKTKRRTKRRTSKKVEQKGGGDITLILDILLSKDIISFMPTSQVFEYEKMSRYMNMIDIHTLKDIVLENSYWRKSPTIQKIFNYTSEELKDPKKIKFDVENINCENLINDRNNNLKKLFLFLFECNKDIFVKENVDWFKVVLGIETFDETFEYQVMKSIIEMGLFMKKEDIMEHIKLLENNMDFKLIVKKRLYSCAEKPRSFFERIFSSKPSFPSSLTTISLNFFKISEFSPSTSKTSKSLSTVKLEKPFSFNSALTPSSPTLDNLSIVKITDSLSLVISA